MRVCVFFLVFFRGIASVYYVNWQFVVVVVAVLILAMLMRDSGASVVVTVYHDIEKKSVPMQRASDIFIREGKGKEHEYAFNCSID